MAQANVGEGRYTNLVAAYKQLVAEMKILEKEEKDLRKKILTAIDKNKMQKIVGRIKNTSK